MAVYAGGGCTGIVRKHFLTLMAVYAGGGGTGIVRKHFLTLMAVYAGGGSCFERGPKLIGFGRHDCRVFRHLSFHETAIVTTNVVTGGDMLGGGVRGVLSADRLHHAARVTAIA
jgi:hypothetical protein